MTSKPRLRIAISDFWYGLNPEDNFFTNILRKRFQVIVDPNPDLLICSVFGQEWRRFPGKKLFFTGEFIPPKPEFFDFSLSFSPRSETNYYFPLYRLYGDYPHLFEPRSITEWEWSRKKPIGTVFSNQASQFRNWVFHQLNRDFGVGSGGKSFNNVGGPVPDKNQFLRAYQFSKAFENAQWSGYTTEKLAEAYGSQTIPIYWGDPLVTKVFNPESFLYMESKADYPRVLERIRHLMSDFDAYRQMYEAPPFAGNREPEFLKEENILDFLESAVASPFRPKKSPTNFAFYRWHSWWDYRAWGESRVPKIRFFQSISWATYLFQLFIPWMKAQIRKKKTND